MNYHFVEMKNTGIDSTHINPNKVQNMKKIYNEYLVIKKNPIRVDIYCSGNVILFFWMLLIELLQRVSLFLVSMYSCKQIRNGKIMMPML